MSMLVHTMNTNLFALRWPLPHLERMSDSIPRLNAALEGRYRIEAELGEGGMATVYLADDIKHERKVALKGGRSRFADMSRILSA